jgi:hypothetical protein
VLPRTRQGRRKSERVGDVKPQPQDLPGSPEHSCKRSDALSEIDAGLTPIHTSTTTQIRTWAAWRVLAQPLRHQGEDVTPALLEVTVPERSRGGARSVPGQHRDDAKAAATREAISLHAPPPASSVPARSAAQTSRENITGPRPGGPDVLWSEAIDAGPPQDPMMTSPGRRYTVRR